MAESLPRLRAVAAAAHAELAGIDVHYLTRDATLGFGAPVDQRGEVDVAALEACARRSRGAVPAARCRTAGVVP